LMIFGGGAIYEFVLCLFIGMISGVYSTVYVATPIALLWHRDKKT
jgi:SecD/SecF fusion protein